MGRRRDRKMATELADASIDRMARKMVNDCGISVFRAVVNGSKAGGNAVLALPEVNWVLATLATVSDNSTRTQLRHMLRQEIVGPEMLDKRIYSMYRAVASHTKEQAQSSTGVALWVPSATLSQAETFGFPQCLRDTFDMDLKESTSDARLLNKWASECTGGKVLRIDGDNNADGSAFLSIVSACKVNWAHSFRKRLTWPSEFLADGNRPQLCQMMHQHGVFGYAETSEYQVLCIETSTPGVKVSFMLPHFGTLDERVAEFTAEKWHETQQQLSPTELKVFIPRFKVDSSCHCLLDDLATAGVSDLKQGGHSTLVGLQEGLSVYRIIHRSVLEVDEAGAEETKAGGFLVSCAAPCQDYRLDRPFLTVVHQHATILQFAKISSLASTI